jgi:hypothetical protein
MWGNSKPKIAQTQLNGQETVSVSAKYYLNETVKIALNWPDDVPFVSINSKTRSKSQGVGDRRKAELEEMLNFVLLCFDEVRKENNAFFFVLCQNAQMFNFFLQGGHAACPFHNGTL